MLLMFLMFLMLLILLVLLAGTCQVAWLLRSGTGPGSGLDRQKQFVFFPPARQWQHAWSECLLTEVERQKQVAVTHAALLCVWLAVPSGLVPGLHADPLSWICQIALFDAQSDGVSRCLPYTDALSCVLRVCLS